MITCIQDIDNLSAEELGALQQIINLISPKGVWNSEALDNAVDVQNRIVAAERRIKIEEGTINYIELLKENIKSSNLTDNEIIYLCVKRCWVDGLYIADKIL